MSAPYAVRGILPSGRARTALLWILIAPPVVAGLVLVGLAVPDQPLLVVAAALVVLGVGVSLVEPAALPVVAMPALLVVARVEAGGVDLSASDLVLAVAFWPAVLLAPRPYSPPMRTLLWLSAVYQTATLFTVIANPAVANAVEWFHAWLLVAGALVMGWAVGRRGYARLGLSLLLAAATMLAVSTIVQGVGQLAVGNLQPVYPSWPYEMHKNFVGTVLAFAAVIAYARPVWLGWTRRWTQAVFWLALAGVALAQSRQALVGLGIALLVVSLRRDPHRRRSKLAVFLVVPVLLFVGSMVRDDIESGNQHNSVFQRFSYLSDAWDVWLGDPLFGRGLRWWNGGAGVQPPNAELEVLTSAGVVGLAGFLVLIVGVLVVLWRADPAFGTLAFSIVLVRVVQAQFDLFWSAVQVSVPFAVAGVCLGAQAWHAERRATEPAAPAATAVRT
jgi:polysaccharide biosynthesis protein PslJ